MWVQAIVGGVYYTYYIHAHRWVLIYMLHGEVDACDRSWGRTPLHLAVRGGHLSTVQALVAAGADANRRCHHKMTALEHAVAALLQRQLQPAGAALPDGAAS